MVEKVLQINRERTIFWVLTGILFISLCFYIYFINVTVHNVVARENFENEASQLTLSIGTSEFVYISKRNAIDLALAHTLGFKSASVKAYISTKTTDKFAYLDR